MGELDQRLCRSTVSLNHVHGEKPLWGKVHERAFGQEESETGLRVLSPKKAGAEIKAERSRLPHEDEVAVGSTMRAGSTETSKQRPRAGPSWKGHSDQDAGRRDWTGTCSCRATAGFPRVCGSHRTLCRVDGYGHSGYQSPSSPADPRRRWWWERGGARRRPTGPNVFLLWDRTHVPVTPDHPGLRGDAIPWALQLGQDFNVCPRPDTQVLT